MPTGAVRDRPGDRLPASNGATKGGTTCLPWFFVFCCIRRDCPLVCRDVPLARLPCDASGGSDGQVICIVPSDVETRRWHISTSKVHPFDLSISMAWGGILSLSTGCTAAFNGWGGGTKSFASGVNLRWVWHKVVSLGGQTIFRSFVYIFKTSVYIFKSFVSTLPLALSKFVCGIVEVFA